MKIGEVRKKFGLDVKKIYMAICPECNKVTMLTYEKGIVIYPLECEAKVWPSQRKCSTKLKKWGVKNGISVRVPLKPLVIQDFRDFLAQFYTRPGTEITIIRHQEYLKKLDLIFIHDINQAEVIHNFKDHEGCVFVDSNDEI